MTTEIVVEAGGLVVRGLAVPYGEETVVIGTTPRGERIVHREMFTPESIPSVGALFGVPLMLSHDDGRPAGRVRLSRSTPRGLEVEADLVGADEEVEGLRRRLAAGLLAGLSVGFIPDNRSDEWVGPAKRGDLPLVKRRNAEVREVSLVQWPAFKSAGVDGVHLRTKVGERRHLESAMAIASAKRMSAEVQEFLARRWVGSISMNGRVVG